MNRIRRFLLTMSSLVTVGASVGSPALAQAQEIVPLAPGTRVRVTMAGDATTKLSGTIERAGADSLVLRVGETGTKAIALQGIQRLDVTHGVRRHPWRGLGYGAVIGASAGALIGLLTPPDAGDFILFTRSEQALMLGTLGSAFGGAIGLAVGAIRKTEDWRQVPRIDGRFRLAVAPTRSSVGLRARLMF